MAMVYQVALHNKIPRGTADWNTYALSSATPISSRNAPDGNAITQAQIDAAKAQMQNVASKYLSPAELQGYAAEMKFQELKGIESQIKNNYDTGLPEPTPAQQAQLDKAASEFAVMPNAQEAYTNYVNAVGAQNARKDTSLIGALGRIAPSLFMGAVLPGMLGAAGAGSATMAGAANLGLSSGMASALASPLASSMTTGQAPSLASLAMSGANALGFNPVDSLTNMLSGGTSTSGAIDAANAAAQASGTAASAVPDPGNFTSSIGTDSWNNIVPTASSYSPFTDQIGNAALGAGGLSALGLLGSGTLGDSANSALSSFSAPDVTAPTGLVNGSMPISDPYTGVLGGAASLGAAGVLGQGGGGVTPTAPTSSSGNWLSDTTGLSSNTLGSLASGVAALYGANQAAGSASDAYALQKQYADADLAERKRQFDLGQAAQMPWRTSGEKALGEQTNLMGLGTQGAEGQLASLMKSPGYEFRLGEGQKALERSAAARGGLFGGKTGKALTEYGQNFATNEYGNRLSQLSSLSGQGQAAASNQAAYGQNYAGNIGNLLTGMGNAGAASSIAQGNAKQSGILGAGAALSNLFNPPSSQQTLKIVNGQLQYA